MKNPLNHRFFVQPSGNTANSRIAGVGEQPGKQEIIDNRPFVGPAGKELQKCATAAGMALSEVYLTNVIKDLQYPLKSYIDIPKDLRQQVVVTEMGKAYINLLKEELEELHPNIVMAIGGIALWALCERRGVMKWRGSIIPSSLVPGMKVVPIIHPSTILPHGDKHQGIFLNSYLITHDMRRVLKHSETPELPAKQWDLITAPSYYSALEFLNFIYLSGIQGDTIDFDIEVVNEELFCIAFSWPPANALSIPLVEGHDYFSIEQEATVMKLIAKILEEPRITKRGHNVAFDCTFLLQKYGIKVQGDLHDTMIAQKITFPDFPAGLDFSTSVHSEIPYYKAEGKKYLKIGGPIKQFWEYNALDALATNIIFPDQMEDLKRQDNVATYDRQRSILYPLVFMMTKGIRIDVEGMLNGRKEAEEKIKELEEKLFTLVGRKINYNSPLQVREYFYEEKGITPYKKRTAKGSKDTTDADALRRIGRRGFEEARIIMRLRTLSTKHLGTYLNLSKIDVDGRYRSAYNPVGARTGRLSSSENIFDTGGNQQNWPHSLTKYLLADEGYIAYSIDLSQAENRIVAYVGRIMEMIDAFESERDVHRLTAGLLLSKMPDEISDEDGSCELGDGTQSERFWGKKANHSLNYDIGYKEFALKNDLTEKEAMWIIERYHMIYPGVRTNYHSFIQSELMRSRTITNLMGRKRRFLDKSGNKLNKEAYAQIPQSTVADIINERGLCVAYQIPIVELLRQVHDDIGFQMTLSMGWEAHAKVLWNLKSSLETPLHFHDREFVIPADITFGLSFSKMKGECVEIKHTCFPATIDELAHMLETGYASLQGAKHE